MLSADRVGAATAVVAVTGRADGSVHPMRTGPALLAARQEAATGRRWAMLDQVHGAQLVDALSTGTVGTGDVLVASPDGPPVAVWSADCAGIVLVGDGGTLVGAHAGWRGLVAGVVDVAVAEVAVRGETVARAVVGPVIGPCCYAFGDAEAAQVAAAVGVELRAVRATTRDGAPALDIPAAVSAALRRHGIDATAVGGCTRCDPRWFSHRGGDTGRHATVAWVEHRPQHGSGQA